MIELSPDDKAFLTILYEATQNGETPSPRKARVLTRDAVSPEFSPRQVEMNYMRGNRLMLPAVYLINPDDPVINKTDSLARAIRQDLIDNPERIEFRAPEVASKLNVAEEDIRLCLEYLTDLRLVNSGSSSGGQPGWDSIKVDEESLSAFLHYPGINECLNHALESLERKTQIVSRRDTASEKPGSITYQKDTAFIMMSMDPTNPQLEDILNCYKEACSLFGITAKRADDIEHSGLITDVVLRSIERSEFLIADLSGERPNVYYEMGYAHAFGKRPIMYRHKDTPLHFDLSGYNVPEYKNVSELRELITSRLEAIAGREPNHQ